MKKLLAFLIVVIIILSVVAVVLTVKYNKEDQQETITVNNDTYQQDTIDETVTVSVSAAGDCTLGTDDAFGIGGSFDLEFENNNCDYSYFFKNVAPIFKSDDITLINLEGPLTDGGMRADKKYVFKGRSEYVNILTSGSVEAVSTANNHSLDYGEEGLNDTLNILLDNGIETFGNEKIAIKNVKGIKVGLIGINALTYADRSNMVKYLNDLKTYSPDVIIVSIHWGEELSTTPDFNQIQLAHSAIDNGADLVLGHHPHVLQGVEKYNGKYIVYSLGNFCFGGHKNPVDKDTMIFNQKFVFKDGILTDNEEVSIVPCSISSINTRNNFQPTPCIGDEFERVKNKIIQLSDSFEGVESIVFKEYPMNE